MIVMERPYPLINRIVGDGIFVRQFVATDAQALFGLVDRNRVRLRKRLYWVDGTRTVSDSQSFIAYATKLQANNGAPTAGIFQHDVMIGTVSLHRINWMRKSSLLGYWLDEGSEGHGVMTRAAAALCDFGFKELGLHRLEIVCAPDNLATQAIAPKLGFKRTPGSREAIWIHDPGMQMVTFAKSNPATSAPAA